jgi:hypothetical protein
MHMTVLEFCKFQPRLNNSTPYFEQLLSLDSTRTAGISGDDFINLFSQCNSCLLLVARGAMERHKCPENQEAVHLACSSDPLTLIARLESFEGEGSGISATLFRQLFVQCNGCLSFIMKRKVNSHECVL